MRKTVDLSKIVDPNSVLFRDVRQMPKSYQGKVGRKRKHELRRGIERYNSVAGQKAGDGRPLPNHPPKMIPAAAE